MISESVLERVRYQTLYPDAAAFIRDNGTMTESQMTGLRVLFASEQDVNEIRHGYIKKRIERSQEAGRPEQQQFWVALDRKLGELQKQAASLLGGEQKDDVQRFIEAFIVLLCAENRYRQKVAVETDGQDLQQKQEDSDAQRTDHSSSLRGGPRFRDSTPPGGRGRRDRGAN